MDNFETPYEDSVEVDFINCEICNKSIRGETLYKIHVTSPGHLKNEETLVAEGKISRQQNVPDFEDIIQYLEYLNIDEPILGLGYFVEVPDESGDMTGIKYNCTLCKVYAYLTEAVQHVIGRKHRQKYLEKNRPDLANWDHNRPQNLSGKIIRAKAEVAERQDGRGTPKPLLNKTKTRRSFTRFSVQGGQNNGQGSSFTQDMGLPMPKFRSHPRGPGRHFSNSDYIQDMCEVSLAYDNRGPLGESEMFSHSYTEAGGCSDYNKKYDYEYEGIGAFSDVPGLHDQDRRNYGHTQREEHYTDDFRKPHTQKDLLKEFYTEELRREQLAKAQQWPRDTDSHQHENMRRVGREIETEATLNSFSTSLDGKNSNEIFKLIKDYRHNAVTSGHPEEALSNPGPGRVSPSRSGEISRKMGDIPDPFMRFLQGGTSHNEPGVRKRKSRFSDATVEELQAAQETFANEYGPPDPKFPSLRPEIREQQSQQTDPHIDRLGQTESYQREPLPEHSESTGDVFEMLKNIEIENTEEANFLKERLCSVLREFKARKAEKTAQNSQSRTVIVKDYNNLRPVTEHHTQDHYDRIPRENTDIRRPEDPYEDPRQNEEMMGEDFQEYQHPGFPETRHSNRNPYREVKRWPNNQPPLAPVFDKPAHFPEKYQEPSRPRDYQSAVDFLDYQSSRSHLSMERGPRMHRPPQYSRNLDKITSTLLELVARK